MDGRRDSETPLLSVRAASFGYGGRAVLRHVDLDVRGGEVLGVVGPNGSGKTTLLRGMLGLLAPQAGGIERRSTRVGYVPQRDSLDDVYPLTALEVVEMGVLSRLDRWRRIPAEERALARTSLERVGLGDQARTILSRMSGGQRQRVLLARALAMRPELLFLDEPTAGVDRTAERAILATLRELAKEGVAIVVVSHNLGSLRDAVDAVCLVAEGGVERGAPNELLSGEQLDRVFGQAEPGE